MAPKRGGGSTDETRFKTSVMVHLNAAYSLARWLTRDERDSEDLVQEACLRAFKFLNTFHGGNSRAWFLAIVRNTYYSDKKKHRSESLNVPFDEGSLEGDDSSDVSDLQNALEALDELPEEFREIIVFRELEDLSYQEIARIAQIPLGTVMSRLSRARKLLHRTVQRMLQEH